MWSEITTYTMHEIPIKMPSILSSSSESTASWLLENLEDMFQRFLLILPISEWTLLRYVHIFKWLIIEHNITFKTSVSNPDMCPMSVDTYIPAFFTGGSTDGNATSLPGTFG